MVDPEAEQVSLEEFSRFWRWFHPVVKIVRNPQLLPLIKSRYVSHSQAGRPAGSR
jgi:hypothetical protein